LKDEYLINGFDFNTYGWIGDIGYVHFLWVSDNMFNFPGILDYFDDAKGLIIDLRHNGGGQHMWGLVNCGRLTDVKRLTHKAKTKNGIGKNDYSEWFEWNVEPEGKYFDKPIVFLTDRYTISAGERMTYTLKVLPNATHMGDTTNGAISTKVGRELANGWKYTIVTQKVVSPDGVYYEGQGIPPEIFVKNTQAEIDQGIDRTLEEALARLNN
jgi:C-terminal processing protease CtpA/Prc